MSKGSTRRPRTITPQAEADAWERTFGPHAQPSRNATLDATPTEPDTVEKTPRPITTAR